MQSKRDQILSTAWRLFESQGYHATGINQIISESGVPKGSFYHYFPDGKEGLALEAIAAITDGLRQKVRSIDVEGQQCALAIGNLFRHIADHLAETSYQRGGPLTTVALETATTNERLNEACQRAYNAVHDEFVKHLVACGGVDDREAHELSTTIVSCLEGGILLSRTFHSTEPMEQVARQVELLLEQRLGSPAGIVERESGQR
jgi:TetR/AcrR family transcriptional regulator, lmrAB and yxaGH operons repressor